MKLNEWIEENQNKEIVLTEDGTIKVIDPEPDVWPADGDEFYSIFGNGDISGDFWDGTRNHEKKILSMGNVFKSEEDAKRAVNRIKARKKFLDAGGHEGMEGFFPRNDFYEYESWEAYKGEDGELKPQCDTVSDICHLHVAFQIWFETEEACQKAIDSLTDEEVKALCYIGE